MELINQVILSIVQGLTEFLPVSSSGHLAILQNFFGEVDVNFDIFLHLATVLAILTYFHKDILAIAKDVVALKTKSQNFKFAIYLVIASIPAGIFGYLLKDSIDSIFSNIIFVAIGFIISGIFLFAASSEKKNRPLKLKNTFIIGLSQALAIFPGISRSGSTVATGLLLGVNKRKAIKFSFLLAVPAIIGASILKVDQLTFSISLLIPFFLSFLTGIITIYIFIEKIKAKNLKYFAYYCWLVALAILISRILFQA
jgi:undecaprenyl-diphosphatase